MRRAGPVGRHVLAGLLLASLAGAASAQAPGSPATSITGWAEIGAGASLLSAGQPAWFDQYLRASLQIGPRISLGAEVSHQQHFGDGGVFLGAGGSYVLDPSWFAALSLGSSVGGFFLPAFRVDGAISRKWLERRELVTTLGIGWYRSKEVYHDLSLQASAAYYFDGPWILEVGLRVNASQPGGVLTARAFGAATLGRARSFYLTVRLDGGGEGYQVVGADAVLVSFLSFEAAVIYRQWLISEWGLSARTALYDNPTYGRWGLAVGVFRDF